MTIPGFFEGTGMPDLGWWEALWPDPAKVLGQVGLRAGMDTVDLCSGPGWFTVPMSTLARRVVAVDIDPALLARAGKAVTAMGRPNVELVMGNAHDVAQLVHVPVDFVFLANVFHGVPDRPRLARAVREVLNPQGLFGIVSWHKRPRDETPIMGEPRGPATELRMSPAQTIEPVVASGFAHVTTVEVSPHHYGAVFRRVD